MHRFLRDPWLGEGLADNLKPETRAGKPENGAAMSGQWVASRAAAAVARWAMAAARCQGRHCEERSETQSIEPHNPSNLIMTVIPRACGVSSTPRLFGSITSVSGILDPRFRGDDEWGCARSSSAVSHSRGAFRPGFARKYRLLKIRGRGECRVPSAPAAARGV
jgi:hypothetical protein